MKLWHGAGRAVIFLLVAAAPAMAERCLVLESNGAHSRLQPDAVDPKRIYSGTEFDAQGKPVRRVDLAGRRGEPVPRAHPYNPETKGFGPKQPLE
jgi:hypothetical protein